MKKKSLLGEIIYTGVSLAKGLGVTFVNLFKKKVTVQYPDVKLEMPEGYRGAPSLPIDPKTGKDKCIACGMCARTCPEQIITIEHEVGEDKKRKLKSFTIDISRCMFCGLCSEACPTKGLVMSHNYELAAFSRAEMIYDMEKLHEIGGFHPAEPDPEPSEEKPETEKTETEGAA